MSKIDVEKNGASQNGEAGTETETLTNRLETVSNLQLAVRPVLELELVTETDRSIGIIAGLGDVLNITALSDEQLTDRCQKLGDFFRNLSGKMTLHTAWLAGEGFSEEHRRLEVKQTAKGKKTSHGLWMRHLKTKYPNLDGRTIRNWVGVYENKGKIQEAGILMLTEAYKKVRDLNALAKGKTPTPEATPPTVAEQIKKLAKTVEDFDKDKTHTTGESMQLVVQIVKDFANSHHVKRFNELFGHLQDIHNDLNAPAVKPVEVTQLKLRAPRRSKVKLNAALLQPSTPVGA
jgi:hypothetical protein